ncbi:MAG TPA: CAP domain-containing protein [Candidatus Saccharimonadales bacterium]|nr:CAP domain-containing protein [Candidatus Saccharimonadales bacterium]
MRPIRVAALVALTLAIVFAPLASAADAATLDSAEGSLLTAVNAFRASRGLHQLVVSDSLTYAAKWMATDMAVNNYFSHTSLDGRSPTQRMSDFGYPATSTWAGEDLAAGYASAADVLQGWINSPAHLAVLLNPEYRAIGIGRAASIAALYPWYWSADFGGIADRASTQLSVDLGFHSAWSGQSPDPTLAPGQTTTLVVALRNTGYRGWYLGSPGQQASLGTADPLDVARPDLAVNWIAANRIAAPTTSWVGPGQVGWFQFTVKAPATPGTYRFGVRGVVDGATWLEDQGITFTITVR